MSVDGGFPRVITISVPKHISEDLIGDYVSERAHNILVELGSITVLRRSVYLRAISERLFVLGFETHQQYAQIKTTNERRSTTAVEAKTAPLHGEASNTQKHTFMEKVGMAIRDKE